jgi:hypothetical protein
MHFIWNRSGYEIDNNFKSEPKDRVELDKSRMRTSQKDVV